MAEGAAHPVSHYGFLGMGIMGSAMAANILKIGHKLTVWNRTTEKCRPLTEKGAELGESPADVVRQCDITISCLADPTALEEVVFGVGGVLEGMTAGKGYIDMSTVDVETSQRISKAVMEHAGEYLEAPVLGSKGVVEKGELVIMAAGAERLFQRAQSGLNAMGKKILYLGDVGSGAKMKLTLNMIMGSVLVALGEGMALAESAGLRQEDLLEILGGGVLASPMIKMKGAAMLKGDYEPAMQISLFQKDLRLAVALGDSLNQPLPLAATANKFFDLAKSEGYGGKDTAAVYEILRKQSGHDCKKLCI